MITITVHTPIDDDTPDGWAWRISIDGQHVDVPRGQEEVEVELPDKAVRFHARMRFYPLPDQSKLRSNPRRVNH